MNRRDYVTAHHLDGENLRVRLFSTITFPIGLTLTNFSNGALPATPDSICYDLRTIINVDGNLVDAA